MPKGGKPAKRRSASFEELQAVDWNTVTKSKKVKYDPNRLIFGATEDGFMELEEVDMDEVNGMLGVTGGGGVASNAKDTSPSTPEDDAEPIKGAKKAVTKKTKADVAGKKASAEKKQSAAASLRRRSASFEELQAVDWDKMTKSTPVKYDPNRLIFGATEDGFMELEEVDMDEVNAMAVGGAAAPGKSGGQRQDVDGEANDDDAADATAAGDDTSDGKPMSAKDARIAKRKARWKAKVEAAKQRKAEARAQAANARSGGGAKTDKSSSSRNADEDAEERYLSDESDDASDDDDAQDQAQDAASMDAGKDTALTAEAKGDAKDAGWQMDYNNYPTAGMGAVVDGVDLDAGADVSNWLQFDLHPALLRALHEHAKHGDPATRATVERLLAAAAAPMLQMVRAWVVAGELEDPRGEFFVVSDPAVGEEDLWRARYSLNDAMRPPFISETVAMDVLRVGKSINFLRRRCDDESWERERSPIVAAAAAAGGLSYGNPAALDALVSEAKRRIDRSLRGVLFERYKFAEHCDAVKRYLLLGQGDFHHYLMDLVGPDLAEPASTVSAYKLTGTLESAIRASNAQFDSSDVLDRLRVRMMPHAGAEEKGWDVFSLEYVVDDPLSTVFTEQAMGKYLRVFNFLWRLKRVEHSLCATWQTMKPNVAASLQRDGVAGAAGMALAGELRRCHTLRGEMHHFIANLQYYVMFEVLEGSWELFSREMEDASDLDSLIHAHERYLDTILQKGLLGPKSQLLTNTLGTLFEVILRFRGFADRLYDVARDAAMRRQLAQLRVEQRAEESKWGSLPGEDAAGGDGLLSEEFVDEMRTQLDAISADYAKMLDGFLNLLPLQTHVDLKFLLFRLDFSEYYQRR